jgi:hypothetical protein
LPTERCGPQHVASFFGTSFVWVFIVDVVAGWLFGVGQVTCWRGLYLAAVRSTYMLLSFLRILDKLPVM